MIDVFERALQVTPEAKGIAWDGCHKIYILLDDEQMRLMAEYEYDPLISSDDMGPDDMARTVAYWYSESCGLRFVSAVRTNSEDPNAGFSDVISQSEGWEEAEAEWENDWADEWEWEG